MLIRIRVRQEGKGGKTLRYEFHKRPKATDIMFLLKKEHPDAVLIGWADEDVIKEIVYSWVRKVDSPVDMKLIKLEDTEVTIKGIPFGAIFLEDSDIRVHFYNYNFFWGLKNVVQ